MGSDPNLRLTTRSERSDRTSGPRVSLYQLILAGLVGDLTLFAVSVGL
jgi:hypothetical protein